ncbi:MAG: type II toxin-antitoxin system VapC family toxin [Trueperaceae bacterium]|nr:MAG: type II toxin-antitoxin system VapC family toxin [Trueperaceae bacterium]
MSLNSSNASKFGVCPFTAEHVLEAKLAYARYGKGQGHAAALNFGDCVSYALAKVEGKPLAFKGEDLNHTDLNRLSVISALPRSPEQSEVKQKRSIGMTSALKAGLKQVSSGHRQSQWVKTCPVARFLDDTCLHDFGNRFKGG